MKNLNKWMDWVKGFRPGALWMSAAPVCIGTVMAFGDGVGHWRPALAALLVVVSLHIMVNLFRDRLARQGRFLGFEDILAFVFFGPVAVVGAYYVQSLEWNMAVVIAGFGPGFLSAGIVAVNDLRDITADRKAGKFTLAARLGPRFVRLEYLLCMIAAAAVPVMVYLVTEHNHRIVLASGVLFLAAPLIHDVMRSDHPEVLGPVMGRTGELLFLYTLLFSFGWLI
ncbi:MAG: UbiA family prenyltransferase [Candidatus Omnitrophica bacterium]|nr:UbiA family prenyltransferase [Candidatus Omnitrophota bacterium]